MLNKPYNPGISDKLKGTLSFVVVNIIRVFLILFPYPYPSSSDSDPEEYSLDSSSDIVLWIDSSLIVLL